MMYVTKSSEVNCHQDLKSWDFFQSEVFHQNKGDYLRYSSTKTDKLLEILPMAIFHGKLDLASETKLPTGITLKVLQSEQG